MAHPSPKGISIPATPMYQLSLIVASMSAGLNSSPRMNMKKIMPRFAIPFKVAAFDASYIDRYIGRSKIDIVRDRI